MSLPDDRQPPHEAREAREAPDEREIRDAPAPGAGAGGAPERESSNFEPDVEVIHRTLLREQGDPEEGREPAPWFVLAAILIGLFWGGWYLGRYGGSFGPATHVAFSGAAASAPGVSDSGEVDMLALGQRTYNANCQACHQSDGQGVPGAFPPLIGSDWVTGPPETVVRILLHGLQGPIEVAGAVYNGLMPAFSGTLTEQQIAAVATYIRQWDANEAAPVETAIVEAVSEAHADRNQPWTAELLRAAEAEGPVAPAATGVDSGAAAPAGAADSTAAPPPSGTPGAGGPPRVPTPAARRAVALAPANPPQSIPPVIRGGGG